MESTQILLGKVVGTPSQTSWVQTYVAGSIFGLVEVTGIDAQATGKQILTKISEVFTEPSEDNLATIKEKVAQAVEGFTQNNIGIVLVKIKEPIIYLVILGGGRIYLRRGAVLAAVLTGGEGLVGGSGYFKGNDVVILTTLQFNKLVSKQQLEEIASLSPAEAAEALSPIIHQETEGNQGGCIIMGLGQEAIRQTPKLLNINWDFVRRNSFILAIILLVILVISIILGVGRKVDSPTPQPQEQTKTNSPTLFFELTLIKNGASGNHFAISGDELAIIDSQNHAIYNLQLTNKSSKVISANITSPTLVSADINNIYVLATSGVFQIKKQDGEVKQVIDKDLNIGEIAGMIAYSTNIYLLDKGKSQLYRFVSGEDKFIRQNYLAADVKPDFGKAVSLAIDSAVYVLLGDGTIFKYLQGAAKAFQVSGLDKEFSSTQAIFTSEDTENIYILDSGNSRVVVIDKEGKYKNQYQWSGIKDVQDLAFWDKEKKLLLLSGNKIYTIPL